LGNEFWAAVVGAIIGGLISGVIQFLSFKRQDQIEREKTRQRNVLISYALMFKIMKIYSDLIQFDDHINECKAKAKENDLAEPHRYFLPLVTLPDPIMVNIDEMEVLIDEHNMDVVNRLFDLSSIHRCTIDLFKAHQSLDNQLKAFIYVDDIHDGIAVTGIKMEDMTKVRPLMFQIDQLFGSISERSAQDRVTAKFCLDNSIKIINQKFGTKIKVESKYQ
jgi:hypothetical protein